MDSPVSKMLLRPAPFSQYNDIEFRLGVSVDALIPKDKTIVLNNGEVLKYDQALIASGADCQRLPFIPGYDASNIFVLRTVEDAHNIYKRCEGKNVLVVGSSFIGMEVASCIVERCSSVIVIGMEKVPFERVLGLEIGNLMQQFHENKKVRFIMEAVVKEFVQSNGEVFKVFVREIKTENIIELTCDMAVLGAGVIPATGYIKEDSTIKIDKDKSIIVDKYLYTGAEGLWAVGDLAKYPLALLNDRLVRVEHWGIAQTQAAIAAKNMVHGPLHTIDRKIPYFWTVQYGKNVRYCGHALNYDHIIMDQLNNDVTSKEFGFVAYYVQEDKVVGACSLGRDPMIAMVAEIMNTGMNLTGTDLKQAIETQSNTQKYLQSKLQK